MYHRADEPILKLDAEVPDRAEQEHREEQATSDAGNWSHNVLIGHQTIIFSMSNIVDMSISTKIKVIIRS